jgi:hypothetical protein
VVVILVTIAALANAVVATAVMTDWPPKLTADPWLPEPALPEPAPQIHPQAPQAPETWRDSRA